MTRNTRLRPVNELAACKYYFKFKWKAMDDLVNKYELVGNIAKMEDANMVS